MRAARTIHIRRLLIRELLALTGVAVALLLGLSWWGLVQATDAQARVQAGASLSHLEREIRTRMNVAEHMGISLSTLWVKGVLDPTEDEDAGRLVLSLLSSQELISVVVLVDRDGSGLFADRRRGEWTTTQLRWSGNAGTLQEKYWKPDGTIRGSSETTPSPADFRERVWYQLAATSSGGAWTEPYIFKRLKVPGFTFAVPVRDPQGELLGCIGIDLVLEELSQLVWNIQPTLGSVVTIADEHGHALVLPRTPELATPEARQAAYLRPLSETFLPVGFAIRNASSADVSAGLRVEVEGKRYFAERRVFEGPRGIRWELSLAIPEDDLLREARRKAYASLGLVALSLGLFALRIRHLANRFGTPLVQLARASEALGRGERLGVARSDIEEVQQLVEAIDLAAKALEERRKLEDQLRHSQRLETLGTLAGGVAHDFNNLLTTILGYGELLLEDETLEPSQREALQEIRAAAERAARLTAQLLAFSRKQVLEPRRMQLNTIVTEGEKMLRRLIGEDIELIVNVAPELWTVKADPGQMEQVVMNLVVNARDAMPKGGTLTVTTRNLELDEAAASRLPFIVPGRYAVLSVSDTGVGISEETKAHIFEPFFTTKERGKGTGLGLATVYGIVKQSGGYILVESAEGKGATFVIYLPRVGNARAVSSTEIPALLPVGARGTETILLVEDETALRGLMQPALESRGYRVLAAGSGEEALSILEREPDVDLLLTDVVMPGMSGPDLADAAAKAGAAPRVLYMSGYTDDALGYRGALTKGTQLITKPFTMDALAQRVRQALDSRPGEKGGTGPS